LRSWRGTPGSLISAATSALAGSERVQLTAFPQDRPDSGVVLRTRTSAPIAAQVRLTRLPLARHSGAKARLISTRREWERTYQVPLNAARARLAAKHHWASGWKPKGRELDCLGISDAGDLLAIEVKPGSANDLEQTPLQVSFYKQMLDKCVEADMERVRRAVETMARQRSRLGLASTAPAVREDPSVIPVIAVGTPSTERARDRFPLVLAALDHELELKGLQIWAIDGHGAVTTTDGSELPI
jgi:hypothetical protein